MMQREEINYEAATEAGGRLATNNNSITQPAEGGTHNHDNTIIHGSGSVMVDYLLTNPHNPPDLISNNGYQQQKQALLLVDQDQDQDQPNSSSINNVGDRTLSFADVMQFADFGPKLALNHHHHRENSNNNGDYPKDTGIDDDNDPVYFLKFPVLSSTHHMHMQMVPFPSIHNTPNRSQDGCFGDPDPNPDPLEDFRERDRDQYGNGYDHHHDQQQINAAAGGVVLSTPTAGTSANNLINNYTNPLQIEFLAGNNDDNLMGLSSSEKIGRVSMEGTATTTAAAAAAAGVGGTILMGHNNNNNKSSSSSSKRKRPRSIKTNEEVESQRMTHIAVERNRRKQMNEHLRVLRSLMPSSYVQRGDQASIIGGAIEFVRELEQLLQCLESQKRRRLYGDQPHAPSSTSTSTAVGLLQPQYPQMPMPMPMAMGSNQYHPHPQGNPDDDQLRPLDHHLDSPAAGSAGVGGGLLREETAESKSCFADVEVKVLGFDALIKILSRRRHGQLIKAIAALEDLHFTILHTNITTIEQTVLYSFNVKVANEARFTAEDIATSVQQIFTFIHANTNII